MRSASPNLRADTPHSPAATVRTHSNVITVFKLAVLAAPPHHLTDVLSDVIKSAPSRARSHHFTRDAEAVECAFNSG